MLTPKLIRIILISFILTGCGRGFHHLSSPELIPYVQDFDSHYHTRVGIPVYISQIEAGLAGQCLTWSDGYREVMISESYYSVYKNDYYAIQQVVWHELGHCVFNLQHDLNLIGTRPKSIMYPEAFGFTSDYKNNLNEYYNELGTKVFH